MAKNDATADAGIDLKKRARRRLVGAAALALFAVVVLSLTMEQNPGPRSGIQETPEILIPSQSGRAPLPARPAPLPAAPVVERPQAPVAGATGNLGPTSPEVAGESRPKDMLPEAVSAAKVAAPKTIDKPSELPPATPGKTVEKPLDKKADEAKAVAALEGKSSSQWVVQLGAYKTAGNVKVLLSKLKELGVPAYTEKFESPQGTRTRVRAGPYASRDAAEKAQRKIRILGVEGPVAPK